MTSVSEGLSTVPEERRSVAPAGGSGVRRSLRQIWYTLTSMRTALLLLFLLAAAAVPGSYFPQRGLNPPAVERYLAEHPSSGPVLDRLGLFDVYAAPWFTTIYLLLAVSLVGCLLPRIRVHARALRARPPAVPKVLDRLPQQHRATVAAPADEVLDRAARALRRRRWRVERRDDHVAAEKGYVRETGNLVFHVALLVLLAGIALGSAYGYKGAVLVVEGDTFTNTPIAYDELHPGRRFDVASLHPFSVRLDDFRAKYLRDGQPEDFAADLTWRPDPDAPERRRTVKVNSPLSVGGSRVYLLDHGYALHLTLTMPDGRVVHDQWTPLLTEDPDSLVSTGVVKVPDVGGGLPQIGLVGTFLPTFGQRPDGAVYSRFPEALLPVFSFDVYAGDLGLDSGVPQNVYALDTSRMVRAGQAALFVGQSTSHLPGGATLKFEGIRDYAVLQVTHDPGKRIVLVAAVAALLGLVLSLRVRRRRVWVRCSPDPAGTLVTVGGLARQDPEGFGAEFDAVVRAVVPTVPPEEE